VADASDLLDEEVHGFGRPVRSTCGLVVGEDLVTPAVDGAAEAGELGDVGVGGVLEEHHEPSSGGGKVGCGVDLRQEFSGEPDGSDLAVTVAGGEPSA
jgi:hypothetical protein